MYGYVNIFTINHKKTSVADSLPTESHTSFLKYHDFYLPKSAMYNSESTWKKNITNTEQEKQVFSAYLVSIARDVFDISQVFQRVRDGVDLGLIVVSDAASLCIFVFICNSNSINRSCLDLNKFDYSTKTGWILSFLKVVVASSSSVSQSHSVLINVRVIM